MNKKKLHLLTSSKFHLYDHRILITDQAAATTRAVCSKSLDDEPRLGAWREASKADDLAEHDGAVDVSRAVSHDAAVSTSRREPLGVLVPFAARSDVMACLPIIVGAVLTPRTTVAVAGLDWGAADSDVLAEQEPRRLRYLDGRGEQSNCCLLLDESVAVHSEH